MKVYEEIARKLDAIERCRLDGNMDWELRHIEHVREIAEGYLPHGSGLDSGSFTAVYIDESKPDRIVIGADYHHMDDGYYAGWSDHQVIVTPSLAFGFNLRITGRDRDGIKDYLAELFDHYLRQDVTVYQVKLNGNIEYGGYDKSWAEGLWEAHEIACSLMPMPNVVVQFIVDYEVVRQMGGKETNDDKGV
jgi:hypothetical protein